jgi:SAM-dependent methyltransferase
VLDAGSGTGRVGAVLHAAGHAVVGVDGDPHLVAAAEADHPGPTWLVGDLAELDLPARGVAAGFDAIVCAGNVMTFLAPGTRQEVLRRLLAHLAPTGRAAVGFGAGRGYPFAEFLDDARAAGWVPDLLLSTWDLRPFTEDADFLVAGGGGGGPPRRPPPPRPRLGSLTACRMTSAASSRTRSLTSCWPGRGVSRRSSGPAVCSGS